MDCSLASLLCPRDSPGRNTGVSCHALLQGIFLTQGSNPGLLLCRHSLPGPSVKELPSLPVASIGHGDTCLTLGHPPPTLKAIHCPQPQSLCGRGGATNFFLLLSGCPEDSVQWKKWVTWGCLKLGLGTPSDTAEMICARLGVTYAELPVSTLFSRSLS